MSTMDPPLLAYCKLFDLSHIDYVGNRWGIYRLNELSRLIYNYTLKPYSQSKSFVFI